ncbi:MAG: hypothetical protein ACXVAX_03705 [Pseudobdellovibrio sp.]
MKFKYLIHPAVFGSLLLTALNDHLLKAAFHNFVTGKISDFTGIFYFPFFLYALVDLVLYPRKNQRLIHLKLFVGFIALTDIIFVLFKLTDLRLILTDLISNHFFKISITPDPTDLSALVMNYFSYKLAEKFKASKAST